MIFFYFLFFLLAGVLAQKMSPCCDTRNVTCTGYDSAVVASRKVLFVHEIAPGKQATVSFTGNTITSKCVIITVRWLSHPTGSLIQHLWHVGCMGAGIFIMESSTMFLLLIMATELNSISSLNVYIHLLRFQRQPRPQLRRILLILQGTVITDRNLLLHGSCHPYFEKIRH
jgi:hypothetical protein